MRDRDLELLVFTMRDRQKNYFKTRNEFYLRESKIAEKKVDDYLIYQEGMFKADDNTRDIVLMEKLVNWIKTALKDEPELMNKGNLDIVKMFEFEN